MTRLTARVWVPREEPAVVFVNVMVAVFVPEARLVTFPLKKAATETLLPEPNEPLDGEKETQLASHVACQVMVPSPKFATEYASVSVAEQPVDPVEMKSSIG